MKKFTRFEMDAYYLKALDTNAIRHQSPWHSWYLRNSDNYVDAMSEARELLMSEELMDEKELDSDWMIIITTREYIDSEC